MYEDYTRQSLPSRRYRELLGTALCVFNSNNSFVIENILNSAGADYKYTWHDLIDKTSGSLVEEVKEKIGGGSTSEIADVFSEIVKIRNRVVHSFQITAPKEVSGDEDSQMLATKHRDNRQELITEEYLLGFIRKNEKLSDLLYCYREQEK